MSETNLQNINSIIGHKLPSSTPEQQGVSSKAILDFVEEIETNKLEVHGFMLLRHHHVIAKGWWNPYKPEYPHIAFSVTKSFTSTAVGFAVQEGLLSVHDRVLPYFSDVVTEAVEENMRELIIKDLLTMTTGHREDTTRLHLKASFLKDAPVIGIGDRIDGDWVKGFFELLIKEQPGTHFTYNSGASHLLAVIVQKVTGQNVLDYLYPRLFIPLGIEKPKWETNQMGEISGGWGLRLKTEDIARLGQLYLNKGEWNGEQILSPEWIEEASAEQVETSTHQARQGITGKYDWEQGYGYQFWQCRNNCYRADGAMGQYSIIMPEQDAIVAINAGTEKMQGILDAVWKHLLPAMKEQEISTDNSSYEQLQQKLSSLALGEKREAERIVTGVKQYKLDANEDNINKIAFHFHQEQSIFIWQDKEGEHSFRFGVEDWYEDNQLAGEKTAAKGNWIKEKTLVIDLYRTNTPFSDRLTCTFTEKELKITHEFCGMGFKERNFSGSLIKSIDF